MNRTIILFVTLLSVPLSPPSQEQAESVARTVRIGPVILRQPVNGTEVSIPVTTNARLFKEKDSARLTGTVTAGLSDLQGKIGAIMDAMPLPTNNCESFSPNNLVVRISGSQLIPSVPGVLLKLNGEVDVWACTETPVPNSKVEWRDDGPLGSRIPHVITWPADPIKTKLMTQPFEASIPATLEVQDAQAIILRIGRPDVKIGGQFATISNGILHIAGVDINAKAKEALDKVAGPTVLQQGIPKGLQKLNPKILNAAFTEDGGALAVKVDFSAVVTAVQMSDLLRLLIGETKKLD